MAAALHVARNDPHSPLYPQPLITDLDLKDNRYPTVPSSQSRLSSHQNFLSDRERSTDGSSALYRMNSDATNAPSTKLFSSQRPSSSQTQSQSSIAAPVLSLPSHSPEHLRGSLSYASPPGTTRRVVERYSQDNTEQQLPESVETRQTGIDSNNRSRSGTPQPTQPPSIPQDRSQTFFPNAPRHPSLPAAGIGSTSATGNSTGRLTPTMPLAASPNYLPPVAPRNRAYPQQPTYITAAAPVNAISSPQLPPPSRPPPEEVCVECTMRDQEMADVDVTSPGAWERASDAAFEDLRQRELEDEARGIVSNDPSRPRIRGGRLTEQNLRLWLSINPKEPAARQQTVNKYVKSQRTLLKEEALARAQAMQEAKQLDTRVRDAYSQLRNSTYDPGCHATFADDTGGVRIRPSKAASPSGQSHNISPSREVTLLQNGLIVEHVDVRKEEREARERKRKEEKRARKSSRSSAVDVTSIISTNSYGRHTDHGANLKPFSRYSQTSSARPVSVLTVPHERPDIPRAYSQASFSDVHSLGSGSPKRKFFGFRNLSAGWRSQDSLTPSAMTGASMMDMHVALHAESNRPTRIFSGTPVELNSPRRSQIWPPTEPELLETSTATKPKTDSGKKSKVFTKFWRKVTGQKNGVHPTMDERGCENVDDFPLAPPPPLSYLVERGPQDVPLNGGRQNSSLSLPSGPPKFGISSSGMSPPTAPSSILPSPVSSRPPGNGLDAVEIKHVPSGSFDDTEEPQDNGDLPRTPESTKHLHPVPEIHQSGVRSPSPQLAFPSTSSRSMQVIGMLSREKSLPPIPSEEPAYLSPIADRPRTVYTYDPRPQHDTNLGNDFLIPPNAPFRSGDMRRQSFGGLSSRPKVLSQPVHDHGKSATFGTHRSFGAQYDEFGSSRRSLNRIDNLQVPSLSVLRSPAPTPKETKRKSKFGLSSLLGKKNTKSQDFAQEKGAFLFPTTSDSQDEWLPNYPTSNSRHSALSMSPPAQFNPRMSVTSRKALEELVSQDSEFVAYRYPSSDQRLDFYR